MSSAADCLTGQAINKNDRVVMLMVLRPKGGYPDADRAAASMAIHPFDTFRPASLPVRGVYDCFGNIVPDHGQVSVELACAMTGARDWDDVCDKALNWQVGAVLNIARGVFHGEQEAQVFGSAIFRESTWHAVVQASPFDSLERCEEIHNAASAIKDAFDFLNDGRAQIAVMQDTDDTKQREMHIRLGHAISVINLAHSGDYSLQNGSPVSSRLLRGLDSSQNHFHEDFRRWMTNIRGPMSARNDRWNLATSDDVLHGILGGIDAVENVACGLRNLGTILRPSPLASRDNAAAVSVLVANTLDDTVNTMLTRIEDCRENDFAEGEAREIQALRETYGRLQETMEKMETVLSTSTAITPAS